MHVGPPCSNALQIKAKRGKPPKFEEKWAALIDSGGDLVVEIARKASFSNQGLLNAPFQHSNQEKYLEPITTPPIKEFLIMKER